MKRQRSGPQSGKATALHHLTVAGIVCVLLVLIFTLWLTGVRVGDSGMAPTLQYGDIIIFDRLSKYIRSPERGDIVAYEGESGALVLGRIVALPGEQVQQVSGEVYVNGALLDMGGLASPGGLDFEPVYVPHGTYFIMPDARGSIDHGPAAMLVPAGRIAATAAVRVSPLGRFGIF